MARGDPGHAALILEADPEMTRSEVKKRQMDGGGPVWSQYGSYALGRLHERREAHVRPRATSDPSRLFNSSLEGNTRRAIDIHEGDNVDARASKALVKAAVAQNGPPAKKR